MGNTCGVGATDPVSPTADVAKPAVDPVAPAATETRTASGTANAEQSSTSASVAAEPPPSAAESTAQATAETTADGDGADGAAEGEEGEAGEVGERRASTLGEMPQVLPSASSRAPKGRRMSGLTRTPTGLEGATKTPERRSSRAFMDNSGKIEASLLEGKTVEGLALVPFLKHALRMALLWVRSAERHQDYLRSGDSRSKTHPRPIDGRAGGHPGPDKKAR